MLLAFEVTCCFHFVCSQLERGYSQGLRGPKNCEERDKLYGLSVVDIQFRGFLPKYWYCDRGRARAREREINATVFHNELLLQNFSNLTRKLILTLFPGWRNLLGSRPRLRVVFCRKLQGFDHQFKVEEFLAAVGCFCWTAGFLEPRLLPVSKAPLSPSFQTRVLLVSNRWR